MPQSDVLIPSLTVQECLRYSALLRLPPDTPPREHFHAAFDPADALAFGADGRRVPVMAAAHA